MTEEAPRKKGVDDATAAWAAGIIDTCGRFTVTITPEGRYDVDLTVTMPQLAVYDQVKTLTRLVNLFGGRISSAPEYTWRLPGHTLRNVYPVFARHVVLQSDQCSITADLFGRTEAEREDEFEMTSEELDIRADLHYAMDTANRRRYGETSSQTGNALYRGQR